MSEANTIQIIP